MVITHTPACTPPQPRTPLVMYPVSLSLSLLQMTKEAARQICARGAPVARACIPRLLSSAPTFAPHRLPLRTAMVDVAAVAPDLLAAVADPSDPVVMGPGMVGLLLLLLLSPLSPLALLSLLSPSRPRSTLLQLRWGIDG